MSPLFDGAVDRHDVRRKRPDRDAYVGMLEMFRTQLLRQRSSSCAVVRFTA